MQPVIELVGPALAYTLKAFVINSVTTISDRMEEAYGTDTTRTFLSDAASGGRASIVGPGGQTLAEADGDEEQLVFADIDPDAVIAPKFVHDTAGHYNRPELFAHLFPEPRPS
jgi:nitrilase